MKINKENLISVCLGLTNLVNKNFTQDFLETEPAEIDLSYKIGNLRVSFKLTEIEKEAENGAH